jgi:glycosyltransferase involved in cell wall biosynthesis
MPASRTVAIVFSQFAPYHADRIEAAARRLAGRAQVLGLEVASRSQTYAWDEAGPLVHGRKRTLFAGRLYETIPHRAVFRRMRRALAEADTVFVGLPYSEPAALSLLWWGRARGKHMVLMSDSKADDAPRIPGREMLKRALLTPAGSALVSGPRSAAYLRSLGFAGKPVRLGYDTLNVERIRALAGKGEALWADRPFLYLGRFVEKKNLFALLDAYARYAGSGGGNPRRLVMAGDGPLRARLERHADGLGIARLVDWPGFVSPREGARLKSGALALCLVSTVEQWGLVLNEAAALGLPAIVSPAAGAGDAFVRHGESGFVAEPSDPESIADAMRALAASEDRWHGFSDGMRARARLGDVAHFADAIERLCGFSNDEADCRAAALHKAYSR